MSDTFCVHGHFYQPPREDPLTGDIPVEPGAAPYRNWNERIHAQCYYPNSVLRNYEHMSFNVGPTLMSWMFDYDPATHDAIIEQERGVYERWGVGNGMAQGYNHSILPLATYQDKVTQVRWGISDFTNRFGHKPAGMWLPETAVDLETLEVLADHDIQFTILAPWQGEFQGRGNVRYPFRVELTGGSSIAVFFYNQDLSTRVSFDAAATTNADRFIDELVMPKFDHHDPLPEILMVASDGELYGHHQPFRDKFLAYLLNGAGPVEIEKTFPGLWLKRNPVTQTTTIHENTSWSCHHGIQRWKGECNCTPHSGWKAPFRKALDELGAAIDEVYYDYFKDKLPDPWELRHRYVSALFGETSLERNLMELAKWAPQNGELASIRLLMRAQFEKQRMFTSCGWFFEDYDRIEPRNNTAYAAQATFLVRQATGIDLSEIALDGLDEVTSYRSGLCARDVFIRQTQAARRRWRNV